EAAIRQFEAEFGIQPPSFIVLHESAAGWATGNAETRASRAILKQLWPSFDFATMGDGASAPAPVSFVNPVAGNNAVDLNGNGIESDTLYLCGSECLVFFLGGLQKRDSTTAPIASGSPMGFS